jgi:hypothetical protein
MRAVDSSGLQQVLNSNGWIKLADEHHRENGREQRQQSFIPRAHNR